MAIWSIGSVSTHVGTLIGWTNLPTGISGTTLNDMISQKINYVEQYTGNTIEDSAISETYQPAIINLTLCNLLRIVEAQDDIVTGAGESVKLGPLSVSSSSTSNSSTLQAANNFCEEAKQNLAALGRKTRYRRVIAC